MIWSRKIQAGALQLVLFVGTLCAVLLLSFVLVTHTHSVFVKKTDVLVDLVKATDAGYEASFDEELPEDRPIPIGEDHPLGIQTQVTKSYWGLLEMRHVEAKKGQLSFEKRAFVGVADPGRPALFLKDDDRPLVLAGKTKISGTAYLPERGVKMGNIYGHSYYAPELIYGKTLTSTPSLPEYDAGLQHNLDRWTRPQPPPQGSLIPLKEGMIVERSFSAPTQWIQGGVVHLKGVTLTGNVIVQASEEIIVEADSKLKDVLLVAPSIRIADWTKGNFQALASQQIHVGKACELVYPTVLAVNRKATGLQGPSMTAHVVLDAYAELRGYVLYKDQGEPDRASPHVHIDDHAKVYGEVWSSQNVELKGSVYGTVTTGSFVAIENGSIYQNHLYNGKIDSAVLTGVYAGISYQEQRPNQIMKWLY